MSDDLADRVEALERTVEQLTERVEDLEASPESRASADGTLDQYDAHVLDALEAGETVALGRLQSLYRSSGIVQKSTLKQRVKRLTSMPYFEHAGRHSWRFKGSEEGD